MRRKNNVIQFPTKNTSEEIEIEAAVFDCGHSAVYLLVDGTIGCVECNATVGDIKWFMDDDDPPSNF
mgnify:CR=1 FL=1|tara:strand:+ start:2801 stop:3001 length:201 start_codon:yes stop_codon:yes gene_type:complete